MDKSQDKPGISKAPTGVAGLDDVLGGGLPAGRTTVIAGGPGSGKTVLSLQSLVHAARDRREPGLFVTFEESTPRILANAAGFDWDLASILGQGLEILESGIGIDTVQSGSFDFGGLLAMLDAKARATGARRIVFDALDVLLSAFPSGADARREVHRLEQWLLGRGVTATITCKLGGLSGGAPGSNLDFLQYLCDCAIVLEHALDEGISQRSLYVLKCRGSAFDENRIPFLIGESGIETALARAGEEALAPVTDERVSSGVERLDTMLGGGYHRGASVLITGAPGTAKTTLSGAFARAACARGEQTLYLSFDSHGPEIVRNLKSVGIDLSPHVESGVLQLVSARSIRGSAESHLIGLMRRARAHGTRCLVVDPISAIAQPGNAAWSHSAVARLIDWTKEAGLTLVCTSLLGGGEPSAEVTPLQISTIADTWMHLTYQVRAGERNRGISIVKSRGTGHSNQVRELVLRRSGVDLADVYLAGGEVLMGSLRLEKEQEAERARVRAEEEASRALLRLDEEAADLESRIAQFSRELARAQAARAALAAGQAGAARALASDHAEMRETRGADRRNEEGAG